jgi:Flp pilus assembly protein TadD
MKDQAKVLDAIKSICDRLSERTATLFLGAGVNFGLVNSAGEKFPTGKDLSEWICRDLLESPDLQLPLDESSGMAIHKFGREIFNNYIHRKFSSFEPGTAHLSLVQLPWDTIFTTNYDQLIENAAKNTAIKVYGDITPIYSLETDLTDISEDKVIYYKLHGCIESANSDEGRLIITKKDYRYYDVNRKPLFKRLKSDLQRKLLVFVGYSFLDTNFQEVLDQCLEELDTKSLPRSYAIRLNFSEIEEAYWLDKYNIQLLDVDSLEFINLLRDTWFGDKHVVVPFEERVSKVFDYYDDSARFQKIGVSFYRIHPSECTGTSCPESFFKGAEPLWSDIKHKIPAERDLYWEVMEALFPELVEPTVPMSSYLISGAAGTGKTTLLYNIAFDIANDLSVPVLMHIPGTPIDARVLGPMIDESSLKRIVIIIRHAGEYISEIERFAEEVKHLKYPITILLEERKNQWNHAYLNKKLQIVEFEFRSLSDKEINKILDALSKHNLLGKLTSTPREYQISHFKDLSDKELIIALRELTSDEKFDKIIKDEYDKIPTPLSKKAYLYVSALSQIDLTIRYETLIRILKISTEDLITDIFKSTEGVLISGEISGSSRHNIGFRLRTRHPIIASIIFSCGASSDDDKYQILNDILMNLDPGYHDDKYLLNAIVKHKGIVRTFASSRHKRAIYDRLEVILPNNQYVLQHRSILERELNDIDSAIKYAKRALEIDKNNPTLKNTLGLALEQSSRFCSEELQRRALVSEATRLFEDGIKNMPSDPFGYLGMYHINKTAIEREQNDVKKIQLEADMLSFLDDAYEQTKESDIIATLVASEKDRFGDKGNAIDVLTKALASYPANTRIRDLLIRMQLELSPQEAIKIALDGVKLDPTSWRLYRHLARLMRILKQDENAIAGNYEASIRNNRGDLQLLVEYASYLFMTNKRKESSVIFKSARDLQIPSNIKNKISEWWKDDNGELIIFDGKVLKIIGVRGWIKAIPSGFESFYWRNQSNSIFELKEGAHVKYTVGFNSYGPTARIDN